MLGFGAIGEFAIGEVPDEVHATGHIGPVPLSVSSIVIPEGPSNHGILVQSTSVVWRQIVRRISAGAAIGENKLGDNHKRGRSKLAFVGDYATGSTSGRTAIPLSSGAGAG
jgi:hypothetical protein